MGTGKSSLYKNTIGNLKPIHLIEELSKSGKKFTEKDIVMITKTKKGELVWLEKGTSLKGLEHIINRHEKDFEKKFGIKKEAIPNFIKDVFTNGKQISHKLKNGGFEKEFLYKGQHLVLTGVGTNGFIISIYPKGDRKE